VDARWDVIHFLLEQYPVAAVIPDVYGVTPLEYARHHKLHTSIIDLVAYSATQYEHYAPPSPRKQTKVGDKHNTAREHTEATSRSDSEGLPLALPALINGNNSKRQHGSAHETTPSHSLWGSDDVSSLGGDFSHFSNSGEDSPLVSSSPVMATVTSLFSSALAFGQGNNSSTSLHSGSNHSINSNISNPMPTYTTPPHRAKTEATTEARLGHGTGSSKPSPRSLLEPLTVASDQSSQQSSCTPTHQPTHELCATSSQHTTSGTVRSKTLLKGNLHVTSPRRRTTTPRKLCTVV
jgi:hypothetical protein